VRSVAAPGPARWLACHRLASLLARLQQECYIGDYISCMFSVYDFIYPVYTVCVLLFLYILNNRLSVYYISIYPVYIVYYFILCDAYICIYCLY
jgi:hypothetical protein